MTAHPWSAFVLLELSLLFLSYILLYLPCSRWSKSKVVPLQDMEWSERTGPFILKLGNRWRYV